MTVAELQEQCFELFRMQNNQNFLGIRPPSLIPPGRAYSTPRLPSCTTVFLLATLIEKVAPPKIAGYGTAYHILHSIYYLKLDMSAIFVKESPV